MGADPLPRARLPAPPWEWARDYLLMALGAAMMSFGVASLLLPAHLADGGLTGVAIVLHYLTGLGIGSLFAALNVPLLAFAVRTQGVRFVWRTLIGVALVSLWMTILAPVHLSLHDPLLAALYGGLLVGAGIGLVLRAGGSTGGTDILARYLHRRAGVGYSRTYLVSDLAVLGAVAIWVGLPAAMYAWIATNVAGRVVSYVVEGPRLGRVALIITAAPETVLARIVGELDRGATRLPAQGAYTGLPRPVLLVALAQREVPRLRAIVHAEDPAAFVVVLPAAEVLGEGFGLLRSGGRTDG